MLKIKELRVEKGIDQQTLAQALKIGKGSISNWEVGRTEPSIDYILSLADYFEVSTDYLLGRSGVKLACVCAACFAFSRLRGSRYTEHLPVVKRLWRHKPLRFYSTVRLTTGILRCLFALPKQLKKINLLRLLSEGFIIQHKNVLIGASAI